MSISLVVDGSPASCRAASKDIRALGERVGTATDMLARSMTTACGAWSGRSSDAFTDFAKERIHRADELHEELLAFASAMEGFGLVLEDVKSEMKRARSIAAGHGIPVGANLPEVGEITLEPGQEGPLDHAIGVANRAREREASLQSAWQVSLARVSKVVWEPVEVNSVGRAATSSGPLDKVKDLVPDLPRLPQMVRETLPSLPDIGSVKVFLPSLASPGVALPLMAIKATKRAFPEQADAIDKGIRDTTKVGLPALATSACVATGVGAAVSPLCGVAGSLAAGPIGDEIVEMTDAN